MANKSSKSPTGEDRESGNGEIRKQETEKEGTRDPLVNKDTRNLKRRNQENLSNRGLTEDQPRNPVRSTGSLEKEQETLPTGEPDPDEQ